MIRFTQLSWKKNSSDQTSQCNDKKVCLSKMAKIWDTRSQAIHMANNLYLMTFVPYGKPGTFTTTTASFREERLWFSLMRCQGTPKSEFTITERSHGDLTRIALFPVEPHSSDGLIHQLRPRRKGQAAQQKQVFYCKRLLWRREWRLGEDETPSKRLKAWVGFFNELCLTFLLAKRMNTKEEK